MKRETINTGFGILVLDRGNVIVGEYSFADGDKIIKVSGGSVIRRWGTTAGLGQLAKDGPTENTVLDPLNGDAFVSAGALIYIVDCSMDRWQR